MKVLKKISLLISFFVLFSCYESLDFDQLDDYVLKPTFTSALTFFTATPGQFFTATGVQQNSITDVSDFETFKSSFVRNNVVKIDFDAAMKNQFDRNVTIKVDFLNSNNISVYSFTDIVIQANDTNPEPYLEEISIATHPNILNTTQVKIRAEIENTGTPLNASDTSEFEFKSSITFYIESSL